MFSGLKFLHEDWSIIHRDLKPQNMMMCENGGKPNLCIGDFGLSVVDDKNVTAGFSEDVFPPLAPNASLASLNQDEEGRNVLARRRKPVSLRKILNQRTQQHVGTRHFAAPEVVSFSWSIITMNYLEILKIKYVFVLHNAYAIFNLLALTLFIKIGEKYVYGLFLNFIRRKMIISFTG